MPECIIATYSDIIDSEIYPKPLISWYRFWIRLLYLNIEVASILSDLELGVGDFPGSVFLVIFC